MLLLGIETSSRKSSVALSEGPRLLQERFLPAASSASASLITTIDALFMETGISFGSVEGIAVGIGPGSFTGIRLGLATARGLSLPRGIPLRGISSFDILVHDLMPVAGITCPFTSAQSHGICAALFRSEKKGLTKLREPFVCTPGKTSFFPDEDIFFLGPDLDRYRDSLRNALGQRAHFDQDNRHPRAAAAAALFDSPAAVEDRNTTAISPLYIIPAVKQR